MKFGIREVCDCHFESVDGKGLNFTIDTARMSTLESASTTVYAQGGRGFARLAAWEGEKTVTFTVEDALLTTESIQALLGEKFDNNKIRVKSTSFAGYYKVTADTLVREMENGVDIPAKITIYKAKLQSNINFNMAPNGDPSTFTFTFDAFPTTVDTDSNVIYDFAFANAEAADPANKPDTTVIINNDSNIHVATITTTTTTNKPKITIASTGAITVTGNATTWTTDGATVATAPTLSLGTTKKLVNAYSFAMESAPSTGTKEIPLEVGSYTTWYII